MKKTLRNSLIVIFLALLAIPLTGFTKFVERQVIEQEQRETKEIIKKIPSDQKDKALLSLSAKKTPYFIPPQSYLEVPFICQAPLQTEENWKYHEESCEEAALLQAYLYETGQTATKEQANEIILDMINWQKKNLGSHHDLHASEMVQFIKGYYAIPEEEIEVIYNAEIDNLKSAIASGHPVIVPITGDILNNPYYPYPGYHMLTAIGYTQDKIITNDNGTRRGENFSYDTEIFQAAMKDAGGDIIILKLKSN